MLNIGTKAPDFALSDQNGELRSLSDFAGKKLLIYFYSKDNTSGCTKQALSYSENICEFGKKGVTVIGVSKDSAASHKKFEEKNDLKFTLLADPDHAMLEAYDVWKEVTRCGKTSMGTVRTTYVIDENGTVIFANDKVKAAEDAVKMLGIL